MEHPVRIPLTIRKNKEGTALSPEGRREYPGHAQAELNSGKEGWGDMGVDRVEEWKRFSGHMEKYIREQTVQKYGIGNSGSGSFDLMTITRPEICVWNILRYSLRNWKGKEHDLEKICHYAQMAWVMKRAEITQNSDSRRLA